MKNFISKKLVELAEKLNKPLYIVGGFCRNFLINGKPSGDIDLCAPLKPEELIPYIKENFSSFAVYENTGTIKFSNENEEYEFTSFRKENYRKGGTHTPSEIIFTDSIKEDALRRDFKCNAVYYDIKNDKFIDPTGGITDIKNKIISTVTNEKEVFSSDGLRLMRLCRFCGELDFEISTECFLEAKKYAKNILDISKERIFDELNKILIADEKYSFSAKDGHYKALKALDNLGVLDYILPELTLGRNMVQRKDYHNFDVLEHSLKCVLYSDKKIRLASLLHDVGKPYCMINYGKFHIHAKEGERIVEEILNRLKASKKTISTIKRLTAHHMLDLKVEMSEKKLRRFIIRNLDIFEELLLLKQADFSACKGDLSTPPSIIKWQTVFNKMKEEKVPLKIKDLKISGKDLIGIVPTEKIGIVLEKLLDLAVLDKNLNKKDLLLKTAENLKNNLI